MSPEKQVECAVEEYKILWDYYKVTLEERRNLFEWYFKVVALPASIVGYILTQDISLEVGLEFNLILGCILVVMFLCGITLYVTYISESINATKYFRNITNIRRYFCEVDKSLSKVFKVDSNHDAKMHINGLDFIKIFKGLTIPIINSAIGLIPTTFLLKIESITSISLAYLLILISHLFLYFMIYKLTKIE